MSTIAVFGGSFDPVHLGHENVVKSLLRSSLGIDKVIIMPAYVSPFKTNAAGKRADSARRLEMCRIAFGDIAECEVSDYEISRGDVSYTVLTLRHLREEYPGDRLILALGSDSLRTLPKWYRFEDIIRLADIAAVSRSEEESAGAEALAETVRAAGGRVFIVNAQPVDISSTDIREKIINNKDISCYVNENVVKYIVNNKLYR